MFDGFNQVVFIDYPKDQNITWNAIVVNCDKQITNGVMNKIAFDSCFFMCTPLLVISFVVASILEVLKLFVFFPTLFFKDLQNLNSLDSLQGTFSLLSSILNSYLLMELALLALSGVERLGNCAVFGIQLPLQFENQNL